MELAVGETEALGLTKAVAVVDRNRGQASELAQLAALGLGCAQHHKAAQIVHAAAVGNVSGRFQRSSMALSLVVSRRSLMAWGATSSGGYTGVLCPQAAISHRLTTKETTWRSVTLTPRSLAGVVDVGPRGSAGRAAPVHRRLQAQAGQQVGLKCRREALPVLKRQLLQAMSSDRQRRTTRATMSCAF